MPPSPMSSHPHSHHSTHSLPFRSPTLSGSIKASAVHTAIRLLSYIPQALPAVSTLAHTVHCNPACGPIAPPASTHPFPLGAPRLRERPAWCRLARVAQSCLCFSVFPPRRSAQYSYQTCYSNPLENVCPHSHRSSRCSTATQNPRRILNDNPSQAALAPSRTAPTAPLTTPLLHAPRNNSPSTHLPFPANRTAAQHHHISTHQPVPISPSPIAATPHTKPITPGTPPSHVLYIAQRFLPLSLPSSSLQHTTSAMSLLTCPLHLSDLPPHFRPSSAPPLFRFRAKCVFSIVNMEISIFTESFVISRDGLSKKSANSTGEQIKRERPRSTRGPSGS